MAENQSSSSKSREEFLAGLCVIGQTPGSRPFMKVFEKFEADFFHKKPKGFQVFENGFKFLESVNKSNFDSICFIKSTDGLEMFVPKDLDFHTLPDYVEKSNRKFAVVDSAMGKAVQMTMVQLLDAFKASKNERKKILNILSNEYEETQSKMADEFSPPKVIAEWSLATKLKEKLRQKLEDVEKELAEATSKTKKGMLKKNIAILNDMLKRIPQYYKHLIISMAGAFTDIHIDFSGTSVCFHVMKGKKIFYVAPRTESNLKIYAKLGHPDEPWIGAQMFDEWSRVEINAGETIFMPTGTLHFVHTPEDTIAFSGNFLMEKNLEGQFEVFTMEKNAVSGGYLHASHMFDFFSSVMFIYAEFVFIPEVQDPVKQITPEQMTTASILYENLKNEAKGNDDWHSDRKKKKIVGQLEAIKNGRILELVQKSERRPNDESDEEDAPDPKSVKLY